MAMRAWIVVGVFILLYQPAIGKPLKRRAKTESTELIREKREEVDEDERSSEMQKFMLDLSSKEDMSRLRERFRSGTTQDIENDAVYRRLKRFSIHDSDDDVEGKSRMSGKETMNTTSSRISRDNGEVASFEEIPLPIAKSTLSYPKEPPWLMNAKTKRSNDESVETHDESVEAHDESAEDGDESGNNPELISAHKEVSKDEEKNTQNNSKGYDNNDKSKYSEQKIKSKYELSIDNLSDGNEHGQNLHDVDLIRRNTADRETAGSPINSHHMVGGSWELIHHYPTALLPSLTSVNTTVANNTTMHSEYLADDVTDGVMQYDADDVTQYKRAGKSRRKPRVSIVRPVRSVETDYEVREISEINNLTPESSYKENGRVVMVNTRAIKRDGYIGCFIDQHPNRDLKKMFTVNNLTPVSCQSVCKEKGHVYAGVQYGYLCHCGDAYGKYGETGEHECNSACLGDEGKKCGGFWRNSVYTSDISDNEEAHDQQEDSSSERETRSHIDRVIPIPQSEQEETPVRQEITVYLRTEIPKKHENPTPAKHKDAKLNKRPNGAATNSKRTEIPTPTAKQVIKRPSKVVEKSSNVMQAKKRTDVSNNAYLHPQTGPTEFVPSNVVLRTLTPSPEKMKYTGFIKLKQNWDDGLRKKTNPKTLILAGNIESAFAEMFAKDPLFQKAEVLSLREAVIRDNPDTVHKVLVEFALLFKKEGKKKDEKLKDMVENSSRLGEMPVFADSLDIKEYSDKQDDTNTDEATPKEKRQDGVDAFLEKVFRQI